MHETALETAQLGQTGLAIVGFRRPGQVDPILPAASLELTDEDVAEIEGGVR
jgi:aryl-alcohol dehydrogenase-like predicted oxidoreductase